MSRRSKILNRCMFSNAKFPKTVWDEALRTIMDLINLSFFIPLDDDDVLERAKDVSYNHLIVFGCKTFIRVPRNEMSKLDGKYL